MLTTLSEKRLQKVGSAKILFIRRRQGGVSQRRVFAGNHRIVLSAYHPLTPIQENNLWFFQPAISKLRKSRQVFGGNY
jgi:hypothetical protein